MAVDELPVLDEWCCPPVLEAPIAADEAEVLAGTLRAMADPIRLRLLSLIGTTDEMCACDLPALVDRSQPTVSHHLKVLVTAGLLRREQRGKWAWYRVDRDRLATLQAALAAPAS